MTIDAMLFLVVMLAITAGGYFLIRKRNKSVPVTATSSPISNNQFKEEFAMEKETKITKEKVKSSENEKIEKIAAAKFEEKIGEEVSP